MSQDKDPLDVEEAVRRLEHALPLQLRSVVAYGIASGSLVGFQYVGLGELFWRFAQADLDDVRRLTEKLVTLGGQPPTEVPDAELGTIPERMVERLIELEREVIEALQDVIPTTGHTGDSEALEHRLEHLIMRKQEQVDALLRALRQP
ncbi:ferritin-like domain-containing protein [Conexibacter sp. SYSU D00693]|uniref:ferritin-like domain-containing protein n=1 Tax=Conexibacter sp. SYSU D00693 TaxID=2812560 RepID=UPI00196B40DB|nr:ferritin-like domain-containing protein [Conexibacter sp. SYSU D00693]